MYYLFSDKRSQKKEKYTKLDGTPDNNGRNGKCEQKFENGCIYRGQFVDDLFHGIGEFTFPEGSVLSGKFEQNHFRKGTISLSVGIKIGCLTETDEETFEDFFKEFKVILSPDCYLTGTTNDRGNLENAQIVHKDEVVCSYQNADLLFKIPGDTKYSIIVSRLWFYIGEVMNHVSENYSGPIFEGKGNQIWYTGIGYNQGFRSEGALNGEQNMLRHCAGLQFFRLMNYTHGRFDNSVTVFNNGLIFTTDGDYFNGILKFILQSGELVEFECSLNDYSSLKLGTLRSRDDDYEIKMTEKGNLLIFEVKGCEYSLEDFKILIS